MKPTFHSKKIRLQQGVAAVEMAFFLLFAVSLLTAPLFLAMYMWYYSALEKAAQNGAAFLATIPAREMKSAQLSGYAKEITEQIANDGTSDLLRGSQYLVDIQCDVSTDPDSSEWLTCGDGVPAQVKVVVRLRLFDTVFHTDNTGDSGWLVKADARSRYVGY
jgi:hypothetical protein